MFGAAKLATYYMGGGGAGGSAPAGYSWDITTATTGYTGTARIGDEDNTASGVTFSSDGTKMYLVGDTNNRINQYTLSTAWNVFTATYSTFVSVAAQETSPNDIAFSSDGTRMFVIGQGNDRVYQYNLSTAWLVSSATFNTNTSISAQGEITPTGIDFSTDGTKMYIVGQQMDTVYQWTLTSAWDINTATYANKSINITTQSGSPNSIRFNNDGTRFFILNSSASVVYQYSVGNAWDVSSATYSGINFALNTIGGFETNCLGFAFKSDGTRVYIVGTTYDYVWSINLANAYDFNTPGPTFSTTDNYRLGVNDSTPTGIKFKPDGTKFYFTAQGNDRVYEYSCSTAWDINTTTYTAGRFISIATQEPLSTDLAFSSDGTKMYIIGTTADTIYQYTLSTAWLITTATYASKSFSVTGQESFPTGIAFKDDGTKFYVVGEGSSRVYQYSCSTAWDISTASYDSVNVLVSGQITTPAALAFGNAGTKMYVLGQGNDLIAQYTLSTAWDVSTAAFDSGKTLKILNVDHQAFGMDIAANGSKIYVVGQNLDRLVQWTLT